jgi:hypothetical protein
MVEVDIPQVREVKGKAKEEPVPPVGQAVILSPLRATLPTISRVASVEVEFAPRSSLEREETRRTLAVPPPKYINGEIVGIEAPNTKLPDRNRTKIPITDIKILFLRDIF